jgi:ankyrin repeat protein
LDSKKKKGKVSAVQRLFEHHASVDVRNKDSWMPLHHASWGGYPDVIQLLLEHGADIEAQNSNDNTPLHLATQQGKASAVRKLLEHHAKIHARNMNSWTPLHFARQCGHSESMQLLLEHCADEIGEQDSWDKTPLYLTASQGEVIAVQKLQYGAGIPVRDKNSYMPPVHQASRGGHPDIIQLLLDHGADIEAQNCA